MAGNSDPNPCAECLLEFPPKIHDCPVVRWAAARLAELKGAEGGWDPLALRALFREAWDAGRRDKVVALEALRDELRVMDCLRDLLRARGMDVSVKPVPLASGEDRRFVRVIETFRVEATRVDSLPLEQQYAIFERKNLWMRIVRVLDTPRRPSTTTSADMWAILRDDTPLSPEDPLAMPPCSCAPASPRCSSCDALLLAAQFLVSEHLLARIRHWPGHDLAPTVTRQFAGRLRAAGLALLDPRAAGERLVELFGCRGVAAGIFTKPGGPCETGIAFELFEGGLRAWPPQREPPVDLSPDAWVELVVDLLMLPADRRSQGEAISALLRRRGATL
jgi:hypothetical protein